MKPSLKAFYYLIDMEEWKLAYTFAHKIDGIDRVHLNLIRVISGNYPFMDCPSWFYDVTEHTIFEMDEFLKDKGLDYYGRKLAEKFIEAKFNTHFVCQ